MKKLTRMKEITEEHLHLGQWFVDTETGEVYVLATDGDGYSLLCGNDGRRWTSPYKLGGGRSIKDITVEEFLENVLRRRAGRFEPIEMNFEDKRKES